MTDDKQLIVLAGGNGAGKSTFFEQVLKPSGLLFVNADQIAKTLNPGNPENWSYEAATVATKIREELLLQGTSFCFETVFSHPSKVDFIADAITKGYHVTLIYIHLINPSLNSARVEQRVHEGGHGVPEEKIHSRIIRTMENVKAALPLVSEALIFDNSSKDDPFKHIASVKKGKFSFKVKPIPPWIAQLQQY